MNTEEFQAIDEEFDDIIEEVREEFRRLAEEDLTHRE